MAVKLTAPMFSLDASGSLADIKFIKNNFKNTFAVSKTFKKTFSNSYYKSNKRSRNLVDRCSGVGLIPVVGFDRNYSHHELIKFFIDDMTNRQAYYSGFLPYVQICLFRVAKYIFDNRHTDPMFEMHFSKYNSLHSYIYDVFNT